MYDHQYRSYSQKGYIVCVLSQVPAKTMKTTLVLFFFKFFIYLWLCWVFISVRGPSPVVASGGHPSPRCAGLSPSRPLVAEHRLQTRRLSNCGPRASCSAARGILPDQGSNPCSPHQQADSQPLRHQGSPHSSTFNRGKRKQEIDFTSNGEAKKSGVK